MPTNYVYFLEIDNKTCNWKLSETGLCRIQINALKLKIILLPAGEALPHTNLICKTWVGVAPILPTNRFVVHGFNR